MSLIACLYQGPGVEQYHLPAISFGEAPLDVTAFALSLLLVFRTDSSYARWEEALRTWNEVRSASKDVARQVRRRDPGRGAAVHNALSLSAVPAAATPACSTQQLYQQLQLQLDMVGTDPVSLACLWALTLLPWGLFPAAPTPQTPQAIYWVDEPARKGMLVRWTMAFSRVLLVHVRADVDLEEQLRGVLLPAEVEAIVAVGPEGAPSFVLQVRGV
jgi:hypothetical protein